MFIYVKILEIDIYTFMYTFIWEQKGMVHSNCGLLLGMLFTFIF